MVTLPPNSLLHKRSAWAGHLSPTGWSAAVMMAGQKEASMPTSQDQKLLEALLDSWDRNNTILVNLLRAVPEGGLDARAVEGSMTVAEMFLHIHGTRQFILSEDAPEFAGDPLEKGWRETRDPDRIAQM